MAAGKTIWRRPLALGIRLLTLAIALGIAIGCGQYVLAPNGNFSFYALAPPSHDPHMYKWFFQVSPGWWPALLANGVFDGAIWAIPVVPFACLIAAALAYWQPLRRLGDYVLSWNWRWELAVAVLTGLAFGMFLTIRAGLTPGMCC